MKRVSPHLDLSPCGPAVLSCVQSDANELRDRFLSMKLPRDAVLFSGERGCWPMSYMPFGSVFCGRYSGSATQPYKFVNSGAWVGYADAAHSLLTESLAFAPLEDQLIVNRLYFDLPGAIAVDRNSTLFQSMHGVGVPLGIKAEVNVHIMNTSDVFLTAHRGTSAAPAGSKPPARGTQPLRLATARNALTGARPLVLHFNGGAKDQLKMLSDQLLAQVRCLPASLSAEKLELYRICPERARLPFC